MRAHYGRLSDDRRTKPCVAYRYDQRARVTRCASQLEGDLHQARGASPKQPRQLLSLQGTLREGRRGGAAGDLAAYNRRRQDLWDRASDRLQALVSRALDVLESAISEGDAKAALGVLRGAGCV
jgi:hypothetical protein